MSVRKAAALILGAFLANPAAAQTYYWNAPGGTDWTAANAWQFNSTTGPAATWVNGNRAVFDSGSGVVEVSTAVVTTGIEFASGGMLTVAPVPSSGGSVSVLGTGTITMTTTAFGVINAPLGGAGITVVRNTPAFTSPTLQLGGTNASPATWPSAGAGRSRARPTSSGWHRPVPSRPRLRSSSSAGTRQ